MSMDTFSKAIAKLSLWATIIVVIVTAFLSLMPGNELPSSSLNDKLNHFIEYGVLAICAVLGRHHVNLLSVFAGVVLYGFLLEGLQGIMGLGRSASWLDALANMGGAFVGLSLALLFEWILRAANAQTGSPR